MVSKLSKKLISNTTYLTSDYVVTTLFSLVYWIIIGKFLSPEPYGIVSTINAIIPFVSMISMLGLSLAIMKLVPEYLVNQKNKIKLLVRFSFKIVSITNVIIVILFLIFPAQIASILKIDTTVLFLSLIGIIFMTFFFMSGSVIYGFQNMKRYFTTNLIGQATKVLVTIFTILLGILLYGPIIGLIASFAIAFVLRFDLEWFKGNSGRFDNKILFKYAVPALFATLLSSVFTYYQYFLIPILQSQYVAGLFAVAFRITTLITMIPAVLINALFPILSKLSATKNSKRLQGILLGSVLRYTLFLIIPLVAFAIVYAKQLVIFFAQSEFLPASSLFPVLAIASAIYGLGYIYYNSLYAIKRPELFRNITILTLAIFLSTSIPLTYLYSSFGLSVSFLLSSFTLFILSISFMNKNVPLKIDVPDIMKIILSTLVLSVISISAESLSMPFIIKVILTMISFTAYLYVLALLKFYNSQDAKILRFLGEKVPFLRRPMNIIANLIS